MTDNFILIFFASLILWGIAFVLVYILLKFMKGTVKISIPRREYHFGEKLSGYVDIAAKKHIDVEKIELEIKAYKKEKTHTSKGTKTQNIEIFRLLEQVGNKDAILAGSKRSIWFNVKIPSLDALPKEVSDAVEVYENINSSMKRFYRGRSFTPKVYWKIKVHVFATGLDLYKQEWLEIKSQK